MNWLAGSWVPGLLGVLAAWLAGLPPACDALEPPTNKIPLRVFYAGTPGSPREADFLAFLRQYFQQVTAGDMAKFEPRSAAGADVVLLDYDGDGFKAPRINLPDSYTRPTITLGVAGGLLCSNLRLKTGYL